MRPFILSLLLLTPALPSEAGQCGSIIASVCALPLEEAAPARKILKVAPTVTPYRTGDRFPVETRSLLLDPARYGLAPSDGAWHYYAMAGVVYRVDRVSSRVLDVIRSRKTAHLR